MKKFLMKHRYGLLLLAIVAVCALCGIVGPLGLAFAFVGVTTTDNTGSETGYPAKRNSKFINIRRRVTLPLARQITTDVEKVVNVKAGWWIWNVALEMVTPSTGDALTVDVGDGGGVDSYDANVNLKGAAGTHTHGAPGTDAYISAGGKHYSADDTIDLKFDTVTNPAGAVVVDVIVVGIDTNA